jgi:cysteine desulfurase
VPRHYLDHASTSPLRPEARDAVESCMKLPTGDPGRLHLEGRAVRGAMEEARGYVAELVGVQPRQIVFTSGGTEAINAAVWGATRARPGAAVLCADVEHSAVREASERWAPVVVIPVDRQGRLDVGSLAEQLDDGGQLPKLVHCQWGNHEVGTIQPVAEVAALCRQAGVVLHVDAAAACGQVPLDLADLGADLVSISAHKLGGPPGVGALVVRRGSRFESLIVGGQQERARRAGMENSTGVVGFGAAALTLAADGQRRLRSEESAARRRTERLTQGASTIGGVSVVGDPDGGPGHRLPGLVCFGVDGVEAESIVVAMDRAGVAVHSGSACSSESLEPSPVLEAMGVDSSHSLRVSVGWSTTDEDVAAFERIFPAVVAELRSLR